MFVDRLEGPSDSQLLDVGPICGSNISFFAQRVHKLYVCDMFLHPDRALRKGPPLSGIWRHLDYPPQSFNGIILWDLPDRMEDQELKRLVSLCSNMVRPDGVVVIFALGEQAVPEIVESFAMEENFQFHPRRQSHLNLPLFRRQNRDVLAVLAPFTPVKSYIHRNGLREFLFRIG
jgi:hypothetical protein